VTTSPLGPGSVLVVDDDDGIRELVGFALRRAGFDVIEASNGQAALDIVAAGEVAMVVLDMGMPEMSGTYVVQALRARPETATLPVLLMTGSGDEMSVIEGLAAGADDFLLKPIRLDELVARINAHLRRGVAWSQVLEERTAQIARQRALIGDTLRGLRPGDTPEATAQAICRHVIRLSGMTAAQIFIFELDGRAMPIGFTLAGAADPPLRRLGSERSEHLRGRAAEGPWIEPWIPRRGHPYNEVLTRLGSHLVAYAPLRSNAQLIGLLVIDAAESVDERSLAESLPALVEFADVAAALIGRDVAARTEASVAREQIQAIIANGAFESVFQPIVDLVQDAVIGYEGLTRFADEVSPEVRFAEATAVGLGPELEAATLQASLAAATALPAGVSLNLNVSPALIMARQPLQQLLRGVGRPVVLEVTEHAQIADYEAFRTSFAALRPKMELAVDDAGAGFASLRHILELRPAFVKLDRSLIAGLESDEARQAMIVGLRHFARSVGCMLIAEGIETEAELGVLRSLEIRFAQGFLLGRPRPVADQVGDPRELRPGV
jgi:EAL domain-containing protein (putative c-di-GMP-specific phosphodiesterase class I)/FixJ family two-component response regulator